MVGPIISRNFQVATTVSQLVDYYECLEFGWHTYTVKY